MNKHTPGPWAVGAWADNGDVRINHREMNIVIASAHNAVSVGDIISRSFPKEQWANAHLIAAAPKMLAALELAEEAYRIGITDVPEEMWQRVNDLREKAIATARGEVPAKELTVSAGQVWRSLKLNVFDRTVRQVRDDAVYVGFAGSSRGWISLSDWWAWVKETGATVVSKTP